MKNKAKEIRFDELKNHFDAISQEVNQNGETVTLTLGSHKVFIVSEEQYDSISRFVIPAHSHRNLTSL